MLSGKPKQRTVLFTQQCYQKLSIHLWNIALICSLFIYSAPVRAFAMAIVSFVDRPFIHIRPLSPTAISYGRAFPSRFSISHWEFRILQQTKRFRSIHGAIHDSFSIHHPLIHLFTNKVHCRAVRIKEWSVVRLFTSIVSLTAMAKNCLRRFCKMAVVKYLTLLTH